MLKAIPAHLYADVHECVVKALDHYGLIAENSVAASFDGASTMSGNRLSASCFIAVCTSTIISFRALQKPLVATSNCNL